MSELRDFAEKLLECEGALVEARSGLLEAVIPASLSAQLKLPEHVLLSEDELPNARRVGYGTELLERLVELATSRVPVAFARWAGGPIKEALVHRAAREFILRNGVVVPGGLRPLTAKRLWLHAAYALQSDERREGLTSAVVSMEAAVPVNGFDEVIAGAITPGAGCQLRSESTERAARAAIRLCAKRAEQSVAAFREGMERRYQRDRERLEGYFADLDRELTRRAARGRIDSATAGDKRQALLRDRAAKLEALGLRFMLRLEILPVAALVVEAPAYAISFKLLRRKASRALELEYDCAVRRLVPPSCDACFGPAERPAACDDALHLLCEPCAPKSEGRTTCAACQRSTGSTSESPKVAFRAENPAMAIQTA